MGPEAGFPYRAVFAGDDCGDLVDQEFLQVPAAMNDVKYEHFKAFDAI